MKRKRSEVQRYILPSWPATETMSLTFPEDRPLEFRDLRSFMDVTADWADSDTVSCGTYGISSSRDLPQ